MADLSREGVEDLTGGVTSEVWTNDILDKNRFWKEELMLVNKDFLFAAWIPTMFKGPADKRSELIKCHAYSVLRAVEIKGQRLVLMRNPWGRHEYTGPWSDGSKEWTAEWIQALSHSFGDDGQFWMTYRDFLRKFSIVDRTRLFDRKWTVTSSRWLRFPVPYTGAYSPLRFRINITEKGPVVIVLSQLNRRYFKGLEGQYDFKLHFRVHREGEDDYITRATANVYMSRSVSVELTLEPGKYVVIFKVETSYDKDRKKVEDVYKEEKKTNRKKFLQVAMSYDLANAKAVEFATEKEKSDEKKEKEKKTEIVPVPKSDDKKCGEDEKKDENDDKEKEKEKTTKDEEQTTEAEEQNEEKEKEEKNGTQEEKTTEDEKAGDEEKTEDNDEKTDEGEQKNEGEENNKEGEDVPDIDKETGLRIIPASRLATDDATDEDPWDPKACLSLRVYSHDKKLTVDVVAPTLIAPDKADVDDNLCEGLDKRPENKASQASTNSNEAANQQVDDSYYEYEDVEYEYEDSRSEVGAGKCTYATRP